MEYAIAYFAAWPADLTALVAVAGLAVLTADRVVRSGRTGHIYRSAPVRTMPAIRRDTRR